MKKIINTILLVFAVFSLSSCLKSGLEDLPEFTGKDITGVNHVEYRYISDQVSPASGQNIVKFVTMNNSAVIDTIAKNVKITVSKPGDFPKSQADKLSLSNLVVIVNLSTAARIAPKQGSPQLGAPGDWSKTNYYVVTAADGTTKEWSIDVSLIANKYEGLYVSNGFFYHPSAPRTIEQREKGASAIDGVSTVKVELGDLGGSNYYAFLTVDPTTNKVSVKVADGAAGGPYTMFTDGLPTTNPGYTAGWTNSSQCNNTYDPATKTFKLRYGYMGGNGWRVTEEILTLK